MLLKRIKVSGLLSFGPIGVDLPLHPLNVLIGPNGSGKSNLLEILALLRAAPKNLASPVKAMGGIREWLWKGKDASSEAVIDVLVHLPTSFADVRHVLALREHGSRFELSDETIEDERASHPTSGQGDFYYRYQRGQPVLRDYQNAERKLKP